MEENYLIDCPLCLNIFYYEFKNRRWKKGEIPKQLNCPNC